MGDQEIHLTSFSENLGVTMKNHVKNVFWDLLKEKQNFLYG